MLSYQIVGNLKIIKRLSEMSLQVQKELAVAIKEQTAKVLYRAKQKVSGQVLKNRTGTLRRKINMKFIESGKNTYGSVGIKLTYAAAHEFGFQGKGLAQVKAHKRKTKRGSLADVKAHARNWKMNLPKRSFLREALKELKPEILKAIQDAIYRGASNE